MTVSVIIPVYNTEKYLGECIDSVLAQTLPVYEIILVDDGSTDSSPVICDEYASRFKHIHAIHKDNGGQSTARNIGIDAAKGDYILFVDSDDLIHPRLVEILSESIRPGDMACCLFSEGVSCKWDDAPFTTEVYDHTEAIERTLYQNKLDGSVCARLIPAQAFDRVRFVEHLWYEDLEIGHRLIADTPGEVVMVNKKMYFYRHTPNSFINTFNTKRLDVLRVTQMIEEQYSHDKRLHAAAIDRKFSANCNMFILSSRAGMNDVAESCWRQVVLHRKAELTNRNVRIKNKLGAVLSYFGKRTFLLMSKFV